jgi:hypothetical protein
LNALAQQGYLQQDRRGDSGRAYWRLRFRFEAGTRTVYLGQDGQLVQQVQAELQTLQSEARFPRRVEHLAKQGRRKLREIKRQIAKVLEPFGFHYHGDAIRRTRVVQAQAATTS